MQRHTLCMYCRQSTKLRETGSPGVYGTMWKHRDQNRSDQYPNNWCPGGGELPMPDYDTPHLAEKPRPRTGCPECHDMVALRLDGTLYNHGAGVRCPGSGQPGPVNTIASVTGGGIGCWPPVYDAPIGVTPVEELTGWWIQQARDEATMVCAKAVEYGATDLRDLGRQILEMAGKGSDVEDSDATEIGIAFYALGKLSRIVAAVKEGRAPSYDSWLDLGVYARMAMRVHTHGGWPAV